MERVRQEKTREEYTPHEYLIYFVDRKERDWWDYVFRTRDGFRHCFVMQWCEWSQRWLMIDWRQTRTDFNIMFDFEAENFIRHIGTMKGTVVRYKGGNPPDSGRLITYCSNNISRFLGLGNQIVLTPYGLYRRLLATGGEVVFDWRDDYEQQAQTDSRPTAARGDEH